MQSAKETLDFVQKKQDSIVFLDEAIEVVKAAHSKGGVCYQITENLLRNYRFLNYESIHDSIDDTLFNYQEYELEDVDGSTKTMASLEEALRLTEEYKNVSSKVKKFLLTDSPRKSGILVYILNYAVNRLEEISPSHAVLIKTTYMDIACWDFTIQQIVNKLGISKTKYYQKKEVAIIIISKVIFGVLGDRCPELPFAKEADLLSEGKEEIV